MLSNMIPLQTLFRRIDQIVEVPPSLIYHDTTASSQRCCSLSVARQMSARASTAAAFRAYCAKKEENVAFAVTFFFLFLHEMYN